MADQPVEKTHLKEQKIEQKNELDKQSSWFYVEELVSYQEDDIHSMLKACEEYARRAIHMHEMIGAYSADYSVEKIHEYLKVLEAYIDHNNTLHAQLKSLVTKYTVIMTTSTHVVYDLTFKENDTYFSIRCNRVVHNL